MHLYNADVDYCNFLHYYEPRIAYVDNDKKKRPFIGLLLCVNRKEFFRTYDITEIKT